MALGSAWRPSKAIPVMFSELSLQYPFRKYQRMILHQIDTAPGDERHHLVLPPGSGKTIVGLELVRRFGQPAVAFAPTTTIQRQWQEKVGMFTEEPDIDLSAGATFCPGCRETLDIGVEVRDAGSGLLGWTLSADGSPITSGSGPIGQTIPWDGAGFGGGSHTLGLHARDWAGNTSDTSTHANLIVPAPPPGSPPGDSPSGSTTVSSGVAQSSVLAPTATPGRVPRPTQTPLSLPLGSLPAAPQLGAG